MRGVFREYLCYLYTVQEGEDYLTRSICFQLKYLDQTNLTNAYVRYV